MSDTVYSAPEAVQRLSRRDPTLKEIDLDGNRHTDAQLAELADCLLAHPDVVTRMDLGHNQLTDETGVKLARYLAASSTIQALNVSDNQLGSATYLASTRHCSSCICSTTKQRTRLTSTRRSWTRCGSIPTVWASQIGGYSQHGTTSSG